MHATHPLNWNIRKVGRQQDCFNHGAVGAVAPGPQLRHAHVMGRVSPLRCLPTPVPLLLLPAPAEPPFSAPHFNTPLSKDFSVNGEFSLFVTLSECTTLDVHVDMTGDQRQQQRRSIRQLHDAITADDVTLVRQLTTPTSGSGQLGYDVDQCLRGVTALRAAAQRGSADLCRCLVAAGADPDRFDPCSGDTALHVAARAGHVDVVRVLLDARADTEITNSKGETALAAAAQASFTRMYAVVLLISAPFS